MPDKRIERTASDASAACGAEIDKMRCHMTGQRPELGRILLPGQLVRKTAVSAAIADGPGEGAVRADGYLGVLHQPVLVGLVEDFLGAGFGNLPADIAPVGKSQAGLLIFSKAPHHGPAVARPEVNMIRPIDECLGFGQQDIFGPDQRRIAPVAVF